MGLELIALSQPVTQHKFKMFSCSLQSMDITICHSKRSPLTSMYFGVSCKKIFNPTALKTATAILSAIGLK